MVNVVRVILRGLNRLEWHRDSACATKAKLGALVSAEPACTSVQLPLNPEYVSLKLVMKPLCRPWLTEEFFGYKPCWATAKTHHSL
jgi:hypothetical protein